MSDRALGCARPAMASGVALVMMDTRVPDTLIALASAPTISLKYNVSTLQFTYYLNLRCARTRRNIVGLRQQRQPPATNRHGHGHGHSHGHGQLEVGPPCDMHTRACAGTRVRTATRYSTTDWHERAASIHCGARATPATASSLRSRRYWRMDEVATLATARRGSVSGHIAKAACRRPLAPRHASGPRKVLGL